MSKLRKSLPHLMAAAAFLAAASTAHAEVKVGAILAVTGPASFLGDPEKKTLEMYVDQINAAGGVNGQKIKLTSMTAAAIRTSRRPLPPA